MITWCHDIGGYIFGKIIKGPKILKFISPKKTWAGLFGGIFFSFLFFFFAKIISYPFETNMISIVFANIFGFLGDAAESKIKRIYNIKDSGSIIPGHGGFLDRFDSFVAINMFFYFETMIIS